MAAAELRRSASSAFAFSAEALSRRVPQPTGSVPRPPPRSAATGKCGPLGSGAAEAQGAGGGASAAVRVRPRVGVGFKPGLPRLAGSERAGLGPQVEVERPPLSAEPAQGGSGSSALLGRVSRFPNGVPAVRAPDSLAQRRRVKTRRPQSPSRGNLCRVVEDNPHLKAISVRCQVSCFSPTPSAI